MKRLLAAFVLGGIVTTGLFYFMSVLISQGDGFKKITDTGPLIDFVRIKQDPMLETRKRRLPEKPPEPKKPPKTSPLRLSDQLEPTQPDLDMDVPDLNVPMAMGEGPFLGSPGGGSGDGGVMPLVRIEPQYPRKAAMSGQEGWVVLKFDITEVGSVSNVEVVNSRPRRVFDMAAKRALLKWKYKPQVVAGMAKAQSNNKVKIEFKLKGQ